MSNTDGRGKGSRVYGKTSDYVLETRLVLAGCSRFTAVPCDRDTLTSLAVATAKSRINRSHLPETVALSERL